MQECEGSCRCERRGGRGEDELKIGPNRNRKRDSDETVERESIEDIPGTCDRTDGGEESKRGRGRKARSIIDIIDIIDHHLGRKMATGV